MDLKQPKVLLRALLILLVITITGCTMNSDIIDKKLKPVQIQEQETKNEATTSNVEEDANLIEETGIEDFDKLGIIIQLPENKIGLEIPLIA